MGDEKQYNSVVINLPSSALGTAQTFVGDWPEALDINTVIHDGDGVRRGTGNLCLGSRRISNWQ